MSYHVIQTPGFGFVFSENFIGIAPAQFLEFLDQAPEIKKKVQDKAPGFLEKVEDMMREGEGLVTEVEELEVFLDNYEEDSSAETGLAALYVEAANESAGISLEVHCDDEKGNIVMLPLAAPWLYSPKELQIESEENLCSILKACCDKTGIICNTDVEFVIAENFC